MPDDSKFSEEDLCSEFRFFLETKYSAVVHPEVSDWDMVAVTSSIGNTAIPFAAHLGIQAKLVANVEVLYQAAVQHRLAPRYRCVLVRRASSEFIDLASHLGLCVAVREFQRSVFGKKSAWQTPEDGFKLFGSPKDFGSTQFNLPPVVTTMPAGTRSPRQLTPWKVKALKICLLADKQGYLTDIRRWLTSNWLVRTDRKVSVVVIKTGKSVMSAQYVLGWNIGEIRNGWEQVSLDLAKLDDEIKTEQALIIG